MRRVAMTGLVALAMLSGVGEATAARSFIIEPELGLKWLSADWGDFDWSPLTAEGNLLGTGVSIGGTFGYHLSPVIALTAHADFGLNASPEDLTLSDGITTISGPAIDSGASLTLIGGGRVYPLGNDEAAPFQPYFGAGIGLGSIAWEYDSDFRSFAGLNDSDGVGALLFALEAGGDVRVSDLVSLGMGGRLIFHNWASESVEDEIDTSDLSSAGFGLVGHITFHP